MDVLSLLTSSFSSNVFCFHYRHHVESIAADDMSLIFMAKILVFFLKNSRNQIQSEQTFKIIFGVFTATSQRTEIPHFRHHLISSKTLFLMPSATFFLF